MSPQSERQRDERLYGTQLNWGSPRLGVDQSQINVCNPASAFWSGTIPHELRESLNLLI